MFEPCIHLFHVSPVRGGCRQVVLEEGFKSSDKHHVPWIAIIPDPAHHPGATSGTDDDLKKKKINLTIKVVTICSGGCGMSFRSDFWNGLHRLLGVLPEGSPQLLALFESCFG